MKLNWGTGITIAIILFMSFIITLVYKGTRINHDLVSKNYYEDELTYQNQIDAQKNAKEAGLKASLNINILNKTINIYFSDSLLSYPSSGIIKMMHGQYAKNDKIFKFENNSNNHISLNATEKPTGNFTLKMNFTIDNKEYYVEKPIYLK